MTGRSFKGSVYLSVIVLSAVLAASSAFAAKLQTFTGTVGDAVCGAKHTMDGDEISCLRTCIQRGSKYDLVVGEKVYVLNLKDQSVAETLDKLASQQARAEVKGEETGGVIEVQSVVAAR
jgi:hypothetical protein